MRAGVEKLSREMGQPEWYRILDALVQAMKPYARHGVNVNVDFYAGVVYYLNGIASDLFVPIFAVGRVPGWVVSVLEQMESNILIRPLTLYNGAEPRDYVKRKRANKEPVMGFGHRVYRAEDPRARHMRAGVEQLSHAMGEPKWYQILAALVDAMKPYARHGVNVNVDFYAGVVYFLNGIAEDLFVPIFAAGRIPGWTVQVVEQLSNNILIRPLTLYNGPAARPYVPIERR
jgi:citrate synthase